MTPLCCSETKFYGLQTLLGKRAQSAVGAENFGCTIREVCAILTPRKGTLVPGLYGPIRQLHGLTASGKIFSVYPPADNTRTIGKGRCPLIRVTKIPRQNKILNGIPKAKHITHAQTSARNPILEHCDCRPKKQPRKQEERTPVINTKWPCSSLFYFRARHTLPPLSQAASKP